MPPVAARARPAAVALAGPGARVAPVVLVAVVLVAEVAVMAVLGVAVPRAVLAAVAAAVTSARTGLAGPPAADLVRHADFALVRDALVSR